jgi:probable rRNA maturation factor
MILNRQRRISIAIRPLADFCQRVRRELRFPEEGVTICLVNDPAMARLNRTFRGKQGSTDVLSFPAMTGPAMTGPAMTGRLKRTSRKSSLHNVSASNHRRNGILGGDSYVGDIAISIEMARRNARRSSHALAAELRILILHGMIHLAGYDHESDQGQMDKFERRLRRRLGLRV